jgi:hypothetical protein
MRTLLLALAALSAALPAAAQQTHQHGQPQQQAQPTPHVQGQPASSQAPDHARYPAGWAVRTDRDGPRDRVWLMDHGGGELHAATGPVGAVYYNPGWAKQGDYAYAARFRQPKASQHPEAYGLVIGGSGLDGAEQRYSYFLVRQTGEFFIADRRGDARTKVVDWTPHAAIRKVEGATGAENVLGVAVQGADVVFSVNGQEVARRPRSELSTDGIAGFRVNHNLEVFIDQVK